MKSYVLLSKRQTRALPPEFQDDDVRYSDDFVEYMLAAYTRAGDVVLDPFAGFGTTIVVAQALGRLGYGVEWDRKRCDYMRSLIDNPARVICGDSRRLAEYDIPLCDFSLTSPPYMAADDEEDPFSAYTRPGHGYDAYLDDLTSIYEQLAALLKPGARAAIEVSNLKGPKGVTSLAWDIARAISRVLTFEGEIVIGWDRPYGYGYDHSYCLVFQR